MKKILMVLILMPVMSLAECGLLLPLSDFVQLMRNLGVTRTEEEKRYDIQWMKSLVEKCPPAMCDAPKFCELLAPNFTHEEKMQFLEWAEGRIVAHPEHMDYFLDLLRVVLCSMTEDEKKEMIKWFLGECKKHPEHFQYLSRFGNIVGATLTIDELDRVGRVVASDALSAEYGLSFRADVLVSLGLTLTPQDMQDMTHWAISFAKDNPVPGYAELPGFLTTIGASLTQDERQDVLESARAFMSTCKVASCSGSFVPMVTTNIVVNYVLNSVQPEFAIPATSDTGFVNIITEVKGGAVAVPASWVDNYPAFTTKFGTDFIKALSMKTGKKDGAGNDMFVWQDYVAGTDPTKEDDVFKASITIADGKVTISYSPELDDERKSLRKYTTWGKTSLLDTDWTAVQEGHETEYNFFKVSVEMK